MLTGFGHGNQRRFRPAFVFAQSDQNLQRNQNNECAGWYDCLLGAHVRKNVFSCCGSNRFERNDNPRNKQMTPHFLAVRSCQTKGRLKRNAALRRLLAFISFQVLFGRWFPPHAYLNSVRSACDVTPKRVMCYPFGTQTMSWLNNKHSFRNCIELNWIIMYILYSCDVVLTCIEGYMVK